jgi:hypothetical protein
MLVVLTVLFDFKAQTQAQFVAHHVPPVNLDPSLGVKKIS